MPEAATMESRVGWRIVAFGDVVRQVKDKVNPEESGLERYVAGEHMDTDDLRIRRWGEIGDGYLGPAFHMRFKPGHVLYGSRRTYLRKVAVADFEGITANTTYVLESADPEVLLPELLPFIMQTEAFSQHSVRESKGSVNPYVNFSDLAWFEFTLPPIDEQRRIAEELSTAHQLEEHYRVLQEKARGLLDSLATSVLHQQALRILYTEPSVSAPEGYRIVTFGDVCDRITYGFTNPMPTTDEGPWMVTATDVRDGVIDYSTARHTSRNAFENDLTAKSRVQKGDVLLTKDGTLGRVAVVDRDDVCVNQSVAVLRPSLDVDYLFLAWTLRAPVMQWRLMLDVGGSAVKHLYITKIADTRFLLPALPHQRHCVEQLRELELAVLDSTARQQSVRELVARIISTAMEVTGDV